MRRGPIKTELASIAKSSAGAVPSEVLLGWTVRHGERPARLSPLDAARCLATYGNQTRAARRLRAPRS
eukprot:6326632-Lingulodinium_polyedra.AAC.1